MKVICVGGGTLGSVTPLLAVIEVWQKKNPDLQVTWWGSKTGPEKKIVKSCGLKYQPICSGKLRRYLSWQNLFDLFRIFFGFMEAWWRLGLNRPDLVLSAGSFLAVPVGWAAWCYKIPLTVHQQDVRPGLANKLLTPLASLITVTWKDSLQHFPSGKTVLTGNPVRRGFLTPPAKEAVAKNLGLKLGRPVVLIMGGGTGAQFINRLVVDSLKELTSFCQVIHLTGLGKNTGAQFDNYFSLPLSDDTAGLFSVADVAVVRAGMATITELAASAKPALVIPMPESHQEDNAFYLQRQQAAVVLPQNDLTAEKFIGNLRRLLADSELRNNLGKNLRNLMNPRAAEAVLTEILKLLNTGN